MSSSKNVLTIKEYWNAGGDLHSEVSGFAILERVRKAVKTVRLSVNRKPDQHSNRLAMFARLHTRKGYQNLGFSEVNLTIDTFANNDKFTARKIYSFSDVRIESFSDATARSKSLLFAVARTNLKYPKSKSFSTEFLTQITIC